MVLQVAAAKDILKQYIKLRNADKKGLDEITTFLTEGIEGLNDAVIDTIGEQEFVIDPDLMLDQLRNYHYLCSGFLGLATGLHRKMMLAIALDHAKKEDGKAVSEAAKDRLAKGGTADIEGLIELLKGIQSNLYERIRDQGQKARRSYGN